MVLYKYRTIPREGLFVNKFVAAYIAGFFDGDGSVRLQLQPRKNAKQGFRVRAIISFAQKTGHHQELGWIRKRLEIGYIYTRNDGITELKIEGFKQVENILSQMLPYIRFKKKQAKLVLKALAFLKDSSENILEVAKISDRISQLNYVTVKKRYTSKIVKEYLSQRHTPVTTDPIPILVKERSKISVKENLLNNASPRRKSRGEGIV
ncbi:MAG: hypothetical protein A3D24_03135 [Candidatus Blackburnbacteria bacterium RIFCSPHIGHO2_02_FULL_39_13]|uniref:Homing endonuclease LAGLIDADG domain-containing protein n=1 Tax=Candidatus Blackburnbacteria bacterium RIFCSPLOWO2_01_FULL_40_20 TaxID=1797519 RepID=A0A1G1VFI0_9BACT|nr:MAG: hypothetical protein A2694_04435 [Candidatus Blackburnbacteria bacterium RIFCSPHIGHO2_01_FULL_40_17]OGY08826.1 MAG: hypothetical protein A3D24_03135 [Candidatus Blackburnbacteria bacterium RIFCSPHIGHO2_02_FULL_39_13]OGY14200.1 MAG: hypothetical protein A3A77_01825 [Candidatus Blackburnbacteria bacterium RIFCSPLOWO2_01_FULL_40_20]HBL51693.1 hypothetical protein [Candidatus Blackburnbacteria bacterium]